MMNRTEPEQAVQSGSVQSGSVHWFTVQFTGSEPNHANTSTTLLSIMQTCVKSVHRTSRRDPNVPQPLDILYVTYRDGNLGFCHTRFLRFIFPGFVHTHSTFTVP